MVHKEQKKIIEAMVFVRLAQLFVNEKYKDGFFKIPIHLALGHEAIAVAVSEGMQKNDRLVLTHRNIHYQLARLGKLQALIDEYRLMSSGLSGGQQGSMNLTNPKLSVAYTSSILGNNFGVGLGIALATNIKYGDGVTLITTGDGAIEEGAFYETMLMISALNLPVVIIVENNEWSLGSKIEERRKPIDLKRLADSLGGDYSCLEGNDIVEYTDTLSEIRESCIRYQKLKIVEVFLNTLGDRVIANQDFPEGKFINYHAGPANSVVLSGGPKIKNDYSDPIFTVAQSFGEACLQNMVDRVMSRLVKDLDETR